MSRHHSSRWLRRACWADGLSVPGEPQRRSASLLLAPDHITVSFRTDTVRLDWPTTEVWTDDDSIGAWWLASWSAGRSRPIGIALHLSGNNVPSTEALRRRCNTPLNRVHRLGQQGPAIPLYGIGHISKRADADLIVMQLLSRLLIDDPSLRRHLADRTRVEQLLTDITTTPHFPVPFASGARRHTVETLQALRSLGYEHPEGGRPMPDAATPSADEIVAAVQAKLGANPHVDQHVDEQVVRDIVEEHYTNIAPWPLHALIR